MLTITPITRTAKANSLKENDSPQEVVQKLQITEADIYAKPEYAIANHIGKLFAIELDGNIQNAATNLFPNGKLSIKNLQALIGDKFAKWFADGQDYFASFDPFVEHFINTTYQHLTPLIHAIRNEKISAANQLFKTLGIDVNASSPDGLTALHAAILYPNKPFSTQLLLRTLASDPELNPMARVSHKVNQQLSEGSYTALGLTRALKESKLGTVATYLALIQGFNEIITHEDLIRFPKLKETTDQLKYPIQDANPNEPCYASNIGPEATRLERAISEINLELVQYFLDRPNVDLNSRTRSAGIFHQAGLGLLDLAITVRDHKRQCACEGHEMFTQQQFELKICEDIIKLLESKGCKRIKS